MNDLNEMARRDDLEARGKRWKEVKTDLRKILLIGPLAFIPLLIWGIYAEGKLTQFSNWVDADETRLLWAFMFFGILLGIVVSTVFMSILWMRGKWTWIPKP